MSNYLTRDEQNTMAANRTAAYRKMAALFPALLDVFQKFDGKVLNCRFEKALKDATGEYIRVSWNYGGSRLDLICYGSAGSQYYLACIKRDDMADGKRINGRKLAESAEEHRNEHLSKAIQLERAAGQVDALKAKLDAIKIELATVVAGIPYEAREIWNLDARIQYI